jgi:hypothetical protein
MPARKPSVAIPHRRVRWRGGETVYVCARLGILTGRGIGALGAHAPQFREAERSAAPKPRPVPRRPPRWPRKKPHGRATWRGAGVTTVLPNSPRMLAGGFGVLGRPPGPFEHNSAPPAFPGEENRGNDLCSPRENPAIYRVNDWDSSA